METAQDILKSANNQVQEIFDKVKTLPTSEIQDVINGLKEHLKNTIEVNYKGESIKIFSALAVLLQDARNVEYKTFVQTLPIDLQDKSLNSFDELAIFFSKGLIQKIRASGTKTVSDLFQKFGSQDFSYSTIIQDFDVFKCYINSLNNVPLSFNENTSIAELIEQNLLSDLSAYFVKYYDYNRSTAIFPNESQTTIEELLQLKEFKLKTGASSNATRELEKIRFLLNKN